MSRSGSLATDWYFLGRVRPIDEIAAELDALTAESVSDYAGQLRKPGEMTVLTLGPTALTLPPEPLKQTGFRETCRSDRQSSQPSCS